MADLELCWDFHQWKVLTTRDIYITLNSESLYTHAHIFI